MRGDGSGDEHKVKRKGSTELDTVNQCALLHLGVRMAVLNSEHRKSVICQGPKGFITESRKTKSRVRFVSEWISCSQCSNAL